uniref:Methyltransferase domain-containing protein n=1 Tax=Ciona savignyi TaxID=51511 RepID=H2ZQP3_CIOSA
MNIPSVVAPEESKGLGNPGEATPQQELDRLWNYVYKMQYKCTKSEYLGGRPVDRDGAYDLCIEPQFWERAKDPNYKCLMYSFGVGNDFTFDDELANRGCEVHSFDPSMDLADGTVRDSGVTFHKLGISNKDLDKDANGWKMRTFKTLLKELGHNGRYMDYLKIDTDAPQGGFEDMLMQELLDTGLHSCVRQYAQEIHLIGPISNPDKLNRCRAIYRQMTELNNHGWRLYNTTDNVRATRYIQKNPDFQQIQNKPGMLNSGGALLWETAFVNFNMQGPCKVE